MKIEHALSSDFNTDYQRLEKTIKRILHTIVVSLQDWS